MPTYIYIYKHLPRRFSGRFFLNRKIFVTFQKHAVMDKIITPRPIRIELKKILQRPVGAIIIGLERVRIPPEFGTLTLA